MSVAVKHAVFVEPDDALRQLLLEWKQRVAKQWPEAPYASHPPHATIWAGGVADPDRCLADVTAAASRFALAPIELRGPMVFEDDALTGGGQTIAFGVVLDAGLANLQQALCDTIRPCLAAVGPEALPNALRHRPFLESFLRYGFPFVGAHWIPHFTVASLPLNLGHPAVAEFLGSACPLSAAAYRLSWWRVLGERHERAAWLT